MARKHRRIPPHIPQTPSIEDAKKALTKAFDANLPGLMAQLRPELGAIVDQHLAMQTPEQAIAACRDTISALNSDDAHTGNIMARTMGSLQKARRRSMEEAGACVDRGDRKGAQKHLKDVEELERIIDAIDLGKLTSLLVGAAKKVNCIKVEGVSGTFPISGAIVGKYVYRNRQFMYMG